MHLRNVTESGLTDMTSRLHTAAAAGLLAMGMVGSSGCILGPKALDCSRPKYNEIIQRTEMEQMLLNLVRLKYREPPMFMEVPNVTEQFNFTGGGGLSGTIKELAPDILGLHVDLKAEEKPTITYTPMQDDVFNKRLIAPIDLEVIDLLTRTGWSASRVLRLIVQNINDVDNATSAGGPTPGLAPEFEAFAVVCDQLRQLQKSRQMEFSYKEKLKPGAPKSIPIDAAHVNGEHLVLAAKEGLEFRLAEDNKLVLYSRDDWSLVLRIAPEAVDSPEVQCIKELLSLGPPTFEEPQEYYYEVRVAKEGQIKDRGTQRAKLHVSTRSFLEMMYYLSQGVSVPCEHIEQGLVTITVDQAGQTFDWTRLTGDLLQIHVEKHRPKCASLAVEYRGYWYYIEDADLNSKSTFNLLLEAYNLGIRGGSEGGAAPILTLGVGG